MKKYLAVLFFISSLFPHISMSGEIASQIDEKTLILDNQDGGDTKKPSMTEVDANKPDDVVDEAVDEKVEQDLDKEKTTKEEIKKEVKEENADTTPKKEEKVREEEYGDAELVGKILISLKIVESKVLLKTEYCSKIMPDGSSYLKSEEDWLKKNKVKTNLIDKFMDKVKWQNNLKILLKNPIIKEMQESVKETGEKAFCENFYKEMAENKYDFSDEMSKNNLKNLSIFLKQIDTEKQDFRRLEIFYSVYGATTFCYANVMKDKNYLKAYNDFKVRNQKEINQALDKITNIDLLEFFKMAAVKNVKNYFLSFKEKEVGCLLLLKRVNENAFDLEKMDDNKKYNEMMFMLNGVIGK